MRPLLSSSRQWRYRWRKRGGTRSLSSKRSSDGGRDRQNLLNSLQRSKSFVFVKQYGKAGVVAHYTCSIFVVSALYAGTTYGLDTEKLIDSAKKYVPFMARNDSDAKGDDEDRRGQDPEKGTQETVSNGGGTSIALTNLAVSIALYKMCTLSAHFYASFISIVLHATPSLRARRLRTVFPVRAMATTAITPLFIRYLRKHHPNSFLLR